MLRALGCASCSTSAGSVSVLATSEDRQVRFLPVCLARYSAASAREMISALVTPSTGQLAIPRLAVIGVALELVLEAIVLRIRSATL